MFLLRLVWAVVRALFVRRADLVAGNLALRQQLIVLHRKAKRPRLRMKDRVFWRFCGTLEYCSRQLPVTSG